MWCCIMCGQPVNVPVTCVECRAVVYCGEECRVQDNEQESPYAHSLWCERMRGYVNHDRQLPFSFIKETTSAHFTGQKYKSFLGSHGLNDAGLWKREFASLKLGNKFVKYGDIRNEDITSEFTDTSANHYIVPEAELLTHKLCDSVPTLSDWSSYYSLRNLPLHSPLAVLLTHSLTVYHIILTHYSNIVKNIPKELHVHLLGVEREIELLPTFKELSHLLPHIRLHLTMYGDRISHKANHTSVEYENMTIHITKGLYHTTVSEPPHLAIGLNAGLVAYSGWCDTLRTLQANHTPAYFTDYCAYSANLSHFPLSHLHLAMSPLTDNPFTSPIRIQSNEHFMPMFSNGFLFKLIYNID